MAGVRHHTHPRFLLKGFASRIEGAKAFAWVYWRDREAQEWSIRDIAVGKHFYGREGDVNADPAITHEEAGFAPLVDDLRRAPDGTQVTDPMIASLVAHLSIRTKHLRDSVCESTDLFLQELERHLSDPGNLRAFTLSDPSVLERAFEEQLDRRHVPLGQRKSLVALLMDITAASLDQHSTEWRALAQRMLQVAASVAPAAIRNGHIRALSTAAIPEPRAEDYRSLRWFVCQSPVPLILGDVGCLFEVSGPRRYKCLTDRHDQVEGVSLPLQSDRVLLGTASSVDPHVDFTALTHAHARCSREFFICSRRSDEMDSLAVRLGEDGSLMTREEMASLMRALLPGGKGPGGVR